MAAAVSLVPQVFRWLALPVLPAVTEATAAPVEEAEAPAYLQAHRQAQVVTVATPASLEMVVLRPTAETAATLATVATVVPVESVDPPTGPKQQAEMAATAEAPAMEEPLPTANLPLVRTVVTEEPAETVALAVSPVQAVRLAEERRVQRGPLDSPATEVAAVSAALP